jgi:hypothetical protein
LFGFILAICAEAAMAAPLEFNDSAKESVWIDTGGTSPATNAWFELGFPESSDGVYANGVAFEYDQYVNDLTALTVTLYGHNDNSSSAINVWFSFDDKVTKTQVASYDVPDQGCDKYFALQLDILSGKLLYALRAAGGTYAFSEVGSLLGGIDRDGFLDKDGLWVGYGCHFNHDETAVYVAANPVPIPGALILLGSGLVGIAAIRRRHKE